MKNIYLFILTAAAAITFTACGGTAENKPANTNTNTAKPTAAAPTAESFLALDKEANEAFIKGDSKFFESFLSDKFVRHDRGKPTTKADEIKAISATKCDVKTWSLDEPQMKKIDDDTYAFSYRGIWDGSCTGADGKSIKMPSPVRAATVFTRSGDKWQAAFHGENLIVDPTKPQAPEKADAGKTDPRTDNKAAIDPLRMTAAVALTKAVPNVNPDELLKAETAVWEAWKDKDAKKIGELTAADISFVNIFGTYFANKADAVKDWTSPACQVKSVKVTDNAVTMLSATVGIITFTGTADGTCGGQKIDSAIWGTSVYIKVGDAWKWAFGMNSPAK